MQNQLLKQPALLPWLMCGLGALFYCYEYFLRISPSVMISELMSTYHLTGANMGSLSAYYYHAYVPMQIIVGLLMDRYGPRRLLTIACVFCFLGTVMFASNQHSLELAKVGRFFVGFGSAFAFVGALKLATIWLPANRFAFISGMITCLGMVGAMVGDIMLEAVVDRVGWHETLYLSGVIGLVLAAILWWVVRDTNPCRINGTFTKMSGHDLLKGLASVFKNPQLWTNGLIGLALYVSLSAFAEVWGISYLQHAHGLTKESAANANSIVFLGWAVGSPFWGWLSDHIGLRRLPLICAAVGAAVFGVAFLYFPHLSMAWIYFLLFGFGFFSGVQVLVFAICHELAPQKFAATAIALTNFIIMSSGSIFQPLIGKLLDFHWTGTLVDGARVYGIEAYQMALGVMPVSIIVAVGLAFFLRETHCRVPKINQ